MDTRDGGYKNDGELTSATGCICETRYCDGESQISLAMNEESRGGSQESSPAPPAVFATPPTVSPTVFVTPERKPFVSLEYFVSTN